VDIFTAALSDLVSSAIERRLTIRDVLACAYPLHDATQDELADFFAHPEDYADVAA
jgi:hypothetical protein